MIAKYITIIIIVKFLILGALIFIVGKYIKKKSLKITLAIIISLLTCWLVMFSIDVNRVNTFRKPIFMYEIQNKCAGKCDSYTGLGYKVDIEYYDNGTIEEITMTMFGKVIAGGIQDIARTTDEEFTIVDETKACDTALELIYEDDNFKYYFECIKSDTVFIVFSSGEKIPISQARLMSSKDWIGLVVEKYPNIFYKEAKQQSQYQNNVSCNNGEFEMGLFSDKKEYKTTDKIKIWTTIKYVGNKDKVTIWHAGSADSDTYFNYLITDGKDFNLQSVTNLMLKSTLLVKDRLYTYDYQKSGGWGADDPNAEFWENFFKEKDLLLPDAEYSIKVKGAFGLSATSQDDVDLACELKIKVEK